MYLVKTPAWLKWMYPSLLWKIKEEEKALYLTFDDGPHETATPFVLDTLKQYNAKATFFCIGKNVVQHKNIYERIIEEGHAVGSHTYNHLNGWKTNDEQYIENILLAQKEINSNLFRPPYGRITRSQIKQLHYKVPELKIVMWDVLSGDFDVILSKEKCADHVIKKAGAGSIIVFHDSTKAWERMCFALPKVLEFFSKQGYVFKAISS
jgi:peptidoglycan/xylan/chitin deacetylase (PgdA/CDA1 family)